MLTRRLALVLGCVGFALSACAPDLCERSAKAAQKVEGDCGAWAGTPLLGAGMACTTNLAACSQADVEILTAAIACVEKLPVCNAIAKEPWKVQEDACTGPLITLSQPCLDALYMGTPPGFDAGLPDAGPQPVSDGGNGLLLFSAATADAIALAWHQRQPAAVAKWLLVETDWDGRNRVETELPVTVQHRVTLLDAGVSDGGTGSRRFFVVALDATGAVLTGTPGSDQPVADAGSTCRSGNDCPVDQVCDLGQCRTQTCPFQMANTCPSAYQCFSPGVCQRTGDAGVYIGPGGLDGGARPLPLVSNQVGVQLFAPVVTPPVPVGFVAARRPDLVGIDTARVFLAAEQEAQMIAHPSHARGTDYPIDALTSAGLDTVGARVHVAWNDESRAVYACYVVGRGVRVQKSTDLGRTWGGTALTLEPPLPDDGGIGEVIRDCDIAAWKNGGALLVTAEPEVLMVRHLSQTLTEDFRGPAFTTTSTSPDAGTAAIFNPSHPSVATAPGLDLAHVTFTANRYIGLTVDTEPYGVMRAGSGSFTAPTRLTGFLPSARPEDWTSVAVSPKTGRAIAAFTTVQAAGSIDLSTTYVAIYNPTSGWGTAPHLNAFLVDQNTSVVLPQKAPTDLWFAFSPQVTALQDGTFAYSFVAGPRLMNSGDYRQYVVRFELERPAQTVAANGWYVLPVTKVSDERALDPRMPVSQPQPPVSALSADTQLTIYGAFTSGTGASGDAEGAAQFFSWP